MDEEKLGEQPKQEQAMIDEEKTEGADSDFGSQNGVKNEGEYGKFKSAEALYEAYKNLQAEFTRKCQKLSEFEKEKTTENNLSESEINDGLSKFLEKNADALSYSDEIKEEIKSEKESDPFESAWAKIVLKRFAGKEIQKEKDPFIQKYVFGDEMLKNKVIEIYMKELNDKKPPVLLSTNSGQRATSVQPVAPSSLKEAKKLVEEMFS